MGAVHFCVFIDGVTSDLGFDFNDVVADTGFLHLLVSAFRAAWIPEQTERLIFNRYSEGFTN